MTVTVSLPDEILANESGDIARRVLEQVAIIGFKTGQLSTSQVRRLLGFDSRLQVHEFLANHGVPWIDYDEEEIRREVQTLKELIP